MTIDNNDWRLTGQEKYLKGVELAWKPYKRLRQDWDHDHCEFCHAKFMESGTKDAVHEGYSTPDNYHWVCKPCYEDFKGMFQWKG